MGLQGQAFFFEGALSNDIVTIPDSEYIRSPKVTVSFWVHPTVAVPAGGVSLITHLNTSGQAGAWNIFFDGSGRLRFEAGNTLVTTNPIPVGVWTHVVASFDGHDGKIYTDGTLIQTITADRPLTYPASGQVRIGGSVFKGWVDNIVLFDRALDPTQVQGLLNGGPETYTQIAGTTTVTGTGVLLSPGDTLDLREGTVTGTGTINSNVINAGTIAPGASPGFLDITGNYTQSPTGVLHIEVAGRDPNVPEFDRLRVTGTATLNGTVRVEQLNGFEPAPGDSFRVITARFGKVNSQLRRFRRRAAPAARLHRFTTQRV